jgi:hypothetical protein
MKLRGTFKKLVVVSSFFLISITSHVYADPLGAIIGGIAGSQFGQGNGKIAMTIIGAVAGDLATPQYQNTRVISNYQTAYYAPPIYNSAPVYYEPPRPRIYYTPPVAPQVYYQPAPVYQYPYQSYRSGFERRFHGNHYRSENYPEYREHREHGGWR